jgi:hypothetical protein
MPTALFHLTSPYSFDFKRCHLLTPSHLPVLHQFESLSGLKERVAELFKVRDKRFESLIASHAPPRVH